MTILNEEQEHALEVAKEAFSAIFPVLEEMEAEYEYAVYRAKRPLQELVTQATELGVPASRLAKEAAGFPYPQKLDKWLEVPPSVLERLEGDLVFSANDSYQDKLGEIETVTRNPKDGKITVQYLGETYVIAALGSDESPWAERDENIPLGVYDMIREKYPTFVDLGEDD